MKKTLLLDNHDSFSYNIVALVREIKDQEVTVISSSKLIISQLDQFDSWIISPGPMTPSDFPILSEVIQASIEKSAPLLGICLGHQAIGHFFGAPIKNLDQVIHGQQKSVSLDPQSPIFSSLPYTIQVGLYHSWVVDHKHLPQSLLPIAYTSEGTLMGIQHTEYPIFGIQFHPESFLTPKGKSILSNFLELKR